MAQSKSDITLFDGALDWSRGVDSIKVPTVADSDNPSGLSRNELSWACNCTLRDGGITPRAGWHKLYRLAASDKLYQGGYMYEPDNAFPYLCFQVSGKLYTADPDGSNPVLISTTAALEQPAAIDYAYFCQGEQFLICQAGDNTTLPLFWDGNMLRRSDGLSKSLGVTSADFTSPAISVSVIITLASPYWQGYDGEIFEINGDTGKKYVKVAENQFFELKNLGGPVGSTVNGGTPVSNSAGDVVTKFLSSWTIPAVGATVHTWVSPAYPGSVGDIVTVGGANFEVTDLTPASSPGLHQIRIVNLNDAAGTLYTAPVTLTSIQELTAGGPMDYYQGRLWYAIGRQCLAGDIVRGPSGTVFYDERDSILKVTENPLCLAGDGFTVPDNAGNIRSLFHNANLNTQLGQGNLYIGTAKQVYSLSVPVTRADWIKADNSNQPQQTVVQINNGTVNDRSCVKVNGDVWYQTLEPSIGSLMANVRNFGQWGQISLSANENRILQFNDRSLLRFASGIYFNNRMLQTALPRRLTQGVVHDAIIPLDFVPMSQFGASLTPNWEGHWQGFQVLQMFTGNFGGRERAFAVVVSEVDGGIDLWEFSVADKFDQPDPAARVTAILLGDVNSGNRITSYVELPAFTGGDFMKLKKLVGGELSIDRLFGTVEFSLDYRPDGDGCWHVWHKWKVCSAKNSCETVHEPQCYPITAKGEGYRHLIKFPLPQTVCGEQMQRPLNWGYSFQPRLTWHGFARIRGLREAMQYVEEGLYTPELICP